MEYQRDTFDPEFDHVYLIDGQGTITDAPGVHEPDVWNHPTDDVSVQGSGWSVLTGHTGQYGYRGAVMHASEQWGAWAIEDLTSRVEEGERIAFCAVEVRDEDGSLPDGDPIGWAVAWKVIREVAHATPLWFVDGHCIAAHTPEFARQETQRIYGHVAETVRPWTAADQEA